MVVHKQVLFMNNYYISFVFRVMSSNNIAQNQVSNLFHHIPDNQGGPVAFVVYLYETMDFLTKVQCI